MHLNRKKKGLDCQGEKDCAQEEINITLSSLYNIDADQGQIKNIIDPPLVTYNYHVALSAIHYPTNYLINLCTMTINDDTKIEIWVNDQASIDELYNILVEKLTLYGSIEKTKNLIKIALSVNKLELKSDYLNDKNFKREGFLLTIKPLKKLVSNFYICVDCVTDEWLKRPLLRILRPDSSFTGYTDKCFGKLHYVKCNKSYINRIEVSIYDQHQNLIKFEDQSEIICNIKFKS